jgi:hypothetical protein
MSAPCRRFADIGIRKALQSAVWDGLRLRGAWRRIHLVGGELTMERVSLARALTWKRRRVYHRMTVSGELMRVEAIERKGRHYSLTLENGHTFLVDRDHVLYTPPKEEQLRLG